MIQELLGAATLITGGDQRKISINGGGALLLPPTTTSPSSPSPSPSITNTTSTPTTTSSNSENQNLRCPRCDSSNTKFCYYNNYNLTQPRHFCKTCRRYWTKGGALRNVPIGGGCRKNKSSGVSNTVAKSSATKMKAVASELGRSTSGHGYEHHEVPPNPILWGSPQNTHLLALLRAGQNQNPNPNPSSMSMNVVKEEGNLLRSSQSHMVMTEPLLGNGLLNPRNIYDAVGQVPSQSQGMMCTSFWRNNQDQIQQQNNNGFVLGELQSTSGVQELYHKLRSSSVNYCSDNSSPMFLGNMASSAASSSLSNILESSSVPGGSEFGCWNPSFTWPDLPTTNGAYP